MNTIHATKVLEKQADESFVCGINFTNVIPDGVTISSVARTVTTKAGSTTSQITYTGATANASTLTDDDGNGVAVGKAAQGTLAAGAANCRYEVLLVATLSNGEIRSGILDVTMES